MEVSPFLRFRFRTDLMLTLIHLKKLKKQWNPALKQATRKRDATGEELLKTLNHYLDADTFIKL